MSLILPINIGDLLHCRGVESARIEFKAGWDEKTTGYQVLKTICAFANDLQNLNGGYIVIGAAESKGCAVLPPIGLQAEEIDGIQKWVRGHCNRIDPEYQPVFSPEVVDGKYILVIWAPGSDIRPHRAPAGDKGEKKFFVRIGSESVDAEKNGVLQDLLQMTARVPFDDRRALQARIEDLREGKVREFLQDINSGLLDENDARELYRKMRISVPVNGHEVPRNIGLLLFSDNPETWFTGVRIEIAQFPADAAGDAIEEKHFRGGIQEQLKSALTYLENFAGYHLEKQNGSFHVKGWVSYPIPALREAVVNAVYHRSYEAVPEPIKIYLYPDRIEIISYPGPIQGVKLEHLTQKARMPAVPARNRRIGEFLKELRLAEGRYTGLPKLFKAMRDNGSRDPEFDFDEERTYLRVTLPAHPEYIAVSTLRDAAHLRAIGSADQAFTRVNESWTQNPGSPSLTAELIRLYGTKGRTDQAESVYSEFRQATEGAFIPMVANVLIETLLDSGREADAGEYLSQLPQYLAGGEALDAAILARRAGRKEAAHGYFERAGDALFHDSRAMHEFARTKMQLAQDHHLNNKRSRFNRETNRRLLNEARELLERVLQMDVDKTRRAWAWRDLGRVKKWLDLPISEVRSAYLQAIELLPNEKKFKGELAKWNETSSG